MIFQVDLILYIVLQHAANILQLSPIETIESQKWHKEVGKVLKAEELKRPISQYVSEAKRVQMNHIVEKQKEIYDGPRYTTNIDGGQVLRN